MTDERAPAAEPDMIAQVGTMLNRVVAGSYGVSDIGAGYNSDDDQLVVLASAILAVAAELRGVRNELVDLRLELSR